VYTHRRRDRARYNVGQSPIDECLREFSMPTKTQTADKSDNDFDIIIDRPNGWVDSTLYSFTAPKPDTETDHFATITVSSITVSIKESFEAFSAKAFQTISSERPNMTLHSNRFGKINDLKAREFIFSWDEEEYRVRERTIFLQLTRRKIILFTANAADGDFDNHSKTFNIVLSGLRRHKH